MTAVTTIRSIDTIKKYAVFHLAQSAANSASPCLSRDLNDRNPAFATAAAAAHANDAAMAWPWLLLELCCDTSPAQTSCARLLRNAKKQTLPMVVTAEATYAHQMSVTRISKLKRATIHRTCARS
jgi:hypothetical protein